MSTPVSASAPGARCEPSQVKMIRSARFEELAPMSALALRSKAATAESAELGHLFVEPREMRRGHGTRLLRDAWARTRWARANQKASRGACSPSSN
jgi:hypothetical protein